jgi:hypothetical protein
VTTPLRSLGCLTLLALFGLAQAQQSPSLDPGAPEVLARDLRQYLVEHLPAILHEDSSNWGHQKLVTRGIEWKGKGNPIPQAQKKYKNQGIWRKTRVTVLTPMETLVLQVRDVVQAGPDRRTFNTVLGVDLRFEAEQQNWRAGVRTYSGSFRARARVTLFLSCEATTKLEKGNGLIPDIVFRMRVLSSNIYYDHLVTEHVLGIGGDMAEWIGDAGHSLLKHLKPSVERNLLQKANAAIVRAADTKEVRVSLGSWLSK